MALKEAGIEKSDLDAIAFTRGPGLLGSLLVGTSFAKGLSASLGIPMIEVNHLQAHILAHFILEEEGEDPAPEFPFLCLLVSGGHTQLVIVHDHQQMEIIGKTIDDAAGEAFDNVPNSWACPIRVVPMWTAWPGKGIRHASSSVNPGWRAMIIPSAD
jgi:N6-L-threonylcarbamoyladenine synthase